MTPIRGKIAGVGTYVPELRITNEDLAKQLKVDEDWIVRRCGIYERRAAGEGDELVEMARRAATSALVNAGIAPQDLNLIIFTTSAPDAAGHMPACRLQASLAAPQALPLDLVGTYTNFAYGLALADTIIRARRASTALVVASERLRRYTDPADAATSILFGDGAGAVIVTAEDGGKRVDHDSPEGGSHASQSGIIAYDWGADGRGAGALAVNSCTGRTAADQGTKAYFRMDGRAIYRAAVTHIPVSIQRAVAAAGLRLEQIDTFILHQANERILTAVARRLGVSTSRFPLTLAQYGNTGSASIPITLAQHLTGKAWRGSGEIVVVSGFGAGFTWATLVVRL